MMVFKRISQSPIIELSIDVWQQAKWFVKEMRNQGYANKYLSMRMSTLQPGHDYYFIIGAYDDFTGTGAIMFDLDGLIECGFFFDGPRIDLKKSYQVTYSNNHFHVTVE
jgi:hypothetical protein